MNVTDTEKRLTEKLGRKPSDEELAKYMKVSLGHVKIQKAFEDAASTLQHARGDWEQGLEGDVIQWLDAAISRIEELMEIIRKEEPHKVNPADLKPTLGAEDEPDGSK